MGRWSYSTRGTTGSTKSLSVFSLRRRNFFDGIRCGTYSWSRADITVASVYICVSTIAGREHVSFQYLYKNAQTGEEEALNYSARLEATRCHFGGERWWFICPCSVKGRYCGRRVGVLYWVGKYFGCRHCHNLAYDSSRNHRSFYENFTKRFAISDKYKTICAGKGRKGFSKRELSQIAKLERKIVRLPEFPPKPVIVYKSLKKDKRRGRS